MALPPMCARVVAGKVNGARASRVIDSGVLFPSELPHPLAFPRIFGLLFVEELRMRAFRLECLGDRSRSREHVCVSGRPSGLGLRCYLMNEGTSVLPFYPEDASIRLKPAEPGLVLTDFLSNTVWCFIANRRTREVVESVCGHEGVEYLPFVLLDHDGERYSDEYSFIHPLQVCDVVDRAASEISYEDDDPSGEILSVEEYVFREPATHELPPLFRVPENPYDIFLNETLARALHAAKITNLFVHEVEVR